MKPLRYLLSPIVLFIVLTLAACGSSSTTTSTSTSSSPSTSGTSSSSATGTLLHTASATVSGKTVTLLTNAQGKTLYYFKADTPTTAACAGGCASTWPPYLATGTPSSATTLTGKLAVQTTANGQQVTYNGHMLYTYSGDSAPGQTNGEGIGNKWFVATNDLAASAGQQNTSSGSNGY